MFNGNWLRVISFGAIFATICIEKSEPKVRTWRGVSRFEDSNTWERGKAPCPGDSIQITDRRSVLVSGHQTVRGLTFPVEGALILSEGAVLSILDMVEETKHLQDVSSACPASDRDILTAGLVPRSWYDPANWGDDDKSSALRLDAELIPCNGDDVEFPSGNSFQVKLPSDLKEPIQLHSFKIGSVPLNQQTLSLYFLTSPNFVPHNQDTQEQTSKNDGQAEKTFLQIDPSKLEWCVGNFCRCGNDRAEVMTNICGFKMLGNASRVCNDPINVTGSCFPLCGASVRFMVDKDRIEDALEVVHRCVTNAPQKFEKLDIHRSILYNGELQIFLRDSSETNDLAPGEAAQLLADFLTEEDGKDKFFTSGGAVVSISGSYTNSNHQKIIDHGASGVSVGAIVGLLFGILFGVVISAVLSFSIWRRRSQNPFSFRPFKADDEHMEMDTGPNFLNPMYNQEQHSGFFHISGNLSDNEQHHFSGAENRFIDSKDEDEMALAENEF